MPKRKRKVSKDKNSAKESVEETESIDETEQKEVVKKKTAKKKATKKKVAMEIENEEVPEEEILTEVETSKPTRKSAVEAKRKVAHGFIPIPKIWPDHLTKYEKSRIIGARALQISMGAPILVESLEKIGNPVKVAEKELEYGILPLTIRRIFPNGEISDVALAILLEND